MKTFKIIIAAIVAHLYVLQAGAETPEVVYLHAPRFLTPLVENWTREYSRLHTQTQFVVLNGVDDSKADARFTASESGVQNADGSSVVVFVGRYALIPFTNQNNPLLPQLKKEGIDQKLLKEVYFERDAFVEEGQPKKHAKYNIFNVYSRSNQAVSTEVFAGFYGQDVARIRGKKINGDESFLVSALRKDTLGLSFNSLNYLYDLETRHVKEGVVPLPLELHSGKKENVVLEAELDLDKILQSLETKESDLIPVERFGVEYPVNSSKAKAIAHFLHWAANEGQNYNGHFGFLSLDAVTLNAQNKQWSNELLTSH